MDERYTPILSDEERAALRAQRVARRKAAQQARRRRQQENIHREAGPAAASCSGSYCP